MNKNEKILIISYLFPPSAGIGGRRWAKIAKHWHKAGNDVEVIASYNPNDNSSPWDKDIESLKQEGKITYTKIFYPNILNSFESKSIFKEIEYRLALILVKLLSKGNYYDRSILWTKHVKRLVRTKINQGFTKVVISGAPFFYLKDIVDLKSSYPKLEVWVDLRDPWSWGKGYGMAALNNKRLAYEKETESHVIRNADLVTVPVKDMLNYINNEYPKENLRKVLPHFYDPDDLPKIEEKKKNNRIELIYAGTIYDGTQKILQQLAIQLLELKNEGKDIIWDFYVPEPENLLSILPSSKYKEVVRINAYVSAKEILEKIANANLYVAVYPERFKNHLSTKFPELWALNTPVIYIGEEGEIAQFIKDNDMGTIVHPSQIASEIKNLLFDQNRRSKKKLDTYSLHKIVGDSFSQNLN